MQTSSSPTRVCHTGARCDGPTAENPPASSPTKIRCPGSRSTRTQMTWAEADRRSGGARRSRDMTHTTSPEYRTRSRLAKDSCPILFYPILILFFFVPLRRVFFFCCIVVLTSAFRVFVRERASGRAVNFNFFAWTRCHRECVTEAQFVSWWSIDRRSVPGLYPKKYAASR